MGSGGGSWAGLKGDCGRGVPRPWGGLASSGGGLGGVDDGALGDGDVNEGLDGVVLGGRLCGGGGRWGEGGVGCGRKEGPYQDRPPLCPFRLLPLLIYSGSVIAFLKFQRVQSPKI